MNARNRWRCAIIISLAFNLFLLCSIGVLSAGIFQTEPVEHLIELDLVSDNRSQQPVDSSQGQAVSTSTTPPQIAVPDKIISSAPVAVQTVTSLSIDEVSNQSIVDTDSGEQFSSSSTSGSPAGSSTARGGGMQPSNGSGTGGQGLGTPSGGILRPQILSQVYPIYPEDARQAGITGTTVLKVQILENGRAGDISIKQSSGHDLLDESAVAAVYKWRFTPAKEKNTGRAVVCYTTVPVVFRLN